MPLPRLFSTESGSCHLSESHCNGGSSQGSRKEEPGFVPKEVQGQEYLRLRGQNFTHEYWEPITFQESQSPRDQSPGYQHRLQWHKAYVWKGESLQQPDTLLYSQIRKQGISEQLNGSPPDNTWCCQPWPSSTAQLQPISFFTAQTSPKGKNGPYSQNPRHTNQYTGYSWS